MVREESWEEERWGRGKDAREKLKKSDLLYRREVTEPSGRM